MASKTKIKMQKLLKNINKHISKYCHKCDDVCCSIDKLNIIFYRHEIKPFIKKGLEIYRLDKIDSKSVMSYIKEHDDRIWDAD